ncbi:MAG: ABC transporter ATP-binding protein, partial [Fibrobacteraceae bacterium]
MSEIRKVLSAKDISIAFGLESPVQVTDKVSFDIFEGEFFALVGESGCGKSVTAMSLLGLLPRPSAKVVSGEALLDGIDLLRLSLRDLQKVRGKKVSCIFQEPMQALDPVCTIKNQLLEVLREDSKESALQKIQDGLAAAGFADVDRVLKSYPCEMSGGMLQRISIVMALLPKPELIIADEPTTALDVTVQASVLLLLKKMAAESHTAVLLITHNMGLVSQYADRVAVMYAGRIVECGSCADVIKTPMHPYTQGLISAIPNGRFDLSHIVPIPGSVPSPEAFVSGCRFAARCPKADKECEAFPTRRG